MRRLQVKNTIYISNPYILACNSGFQSTGLQNMKHPLPEIYQKSASSLSLRVLRRIDTNVEEILSSAPCVALYEMTDKKHRQWSRTEVQGALFVVKRKTQPRFHFIILNRRSSAQNLVHDLLSGFEYEIQVPYLVYGYLQSVCCGSLYVHLHMHLFYFNLSSSSSMS